MQLIYSTEVTQSFHTILEDTYLFIPPWLEFKNSATVEIGILQSQPFRNSNFHSLITMESATYKTLIKGLKFCFCNCVVQIRSSSDGPTGAIIIIIIVYVRSAIFERTVPFLTCCTLSTPSNVIKTRQLLFETKDTKGRLYT